MHAVVLTIHTILVLALVGVVLLQRSEGGALGMGGGGGGGGGFMTGRGAANALTRTTTVLAALFFVTSMGLALMTDRGVSQSDIVNSITGDDGSSADEPGGIGGDDVLESLGLGTESSAPSAASPIDVLPESLTDSETPSADTAETEETPDQPQ